MHDAGGVWREDRHFDLTLGAHARTGAFCRVLYPLEAVNHLYLAQVGEEIFIRYVEVSLERRGDEKVTYLDRRPDVLDCVVTAFFFTVRSDEAVITHIEVAVELVVHIAALDGLVHEGPDEATGKERMAGPVVPEVLEACSAALVGVGVHKLSRHKHLVTVGEPSHSGQVGRVMVGVEIVEVSPRMNHVALLRVVLVEEFVELGVPSSLVAVVPKDDARMVDVFSDHLAHELRAHRVVIAAVPSCKLVEVEEAE